MDSRALIAWRIPAKHRSLHSYKKILMSEDCWIKVQIFPSVSLRYVPVTWVRRPGVRTEESGPRLRMAVLVPSGTRVPALPAIPTKFFRIFF